MRFPMSKHCSTFCRANLLTKSDLRQDPGYEVVKLLAISESSRRLGLVACLEGHNLVPRARDLQEKNRELWDNP